jgi:hypothetical protein
MGTIRGLGVDVDEGMSHEVGLHAGGPVVRLLEGKDHRCPVDAQP